MQFQRKYSIVETRSGYFYHSDMGFIVIKVFDFRRAGFFLLTDKMGVLK